MDAFLKRVTWDHSEICKNMLEFENLSILELEEDDNWEEVDISNGSPTTPMEARVNLDLCRVCFINEKNCALLPCGHLYFCMDCYEQHKKTDTTIFNALAYVDNNDEFDEVNIENEKHSEAVKCPYCNEVSTDAIQVRFT